MKKDAKEETKKKVVGWSTEKRAESESQKTRKKRYIGAASTRKD